jgi:hypothetical protein
VTNLIVHYGVSISESALVLGAWKFQQREILQLWQIWPRVLGDFLFLFSAKEGF